MSEQADPGTTPENTEAAQAATSTGTEEIGELNNGIPPKKEEPKEEAPKETPKENPAEQKTETQSKDERHFSRKINEINESRMSFAKKLVEKDKDSIYDIAEDDPKLASKLLDEYDFGAESVEELMELRDNPDQKPEEVKRKVEENSRMSKIEEELFAEKLNRLKTQHEDLDDDLAAEYKKVYSNPAFEGKSESQMLNIARASLGKEPEPKKVDNSALEILKAQEGFTSSPKQSGDIKKKAVIKPEEADAFRKGGVTEADIEKYLPENFDELYSPQMAGLGSDE